MSRIGRRLSERSLAILGKLASGGEWVLNDFINASRQYDRKIHYAIAKQMYNLRRAGYVARRQSQNQSFFHLTPKGKLQFLKYFHLEKIRNRTWDRRWRVAIFDIPEDRKKWREHIRHELRELGFRPLQESVYITPYPVTGELDRFLKKWKMRRYFRYLTVSEIDDEAELKNKFSLK